MNNEQKVWTDILANKTKIRFVRRVSANHKWLSDVDTIRQDQTPSGESIRRFVNKCIYAFYTYEQLYVMGCYGCIERFFDSTTRIIVYTGYREIHHGVEPSPCCLVKSISFHLPQTVFQKAIVLGESHEDFIQILSKAANNTHRDDNKYLL